MTFPRALLATVGAVILQVLMGYLWPAATRFVDPFLVVAVVSGLTLPRVSSLFAGLAAGLARDSLWSDLFGLHGFTKVVVAYSASALGSRLDLAQPAPRILALGAASAVDCGLQLLLAGAMGEAPAIPPPGAWLLSAGSTVVLGLLAFALVDRSRARA